MRVFIDGAIVCDARGEIRPARHRCRRGLSARVTMRFVRGSAGRVTRESEIGRER